MQAPDLNLADFKTNQRMSLSDFKGKPVLITFWVSWCPDCQRDLPKKAEFYESMDKDAVGFLSINVTGREGSPEDGPAFAKKHNLPFPVLLDEGTKTYDAYQCTSVPTTVVLDDHHQIIQKFGDQASFYEIVKALSMVMK